LPPENIPTPNPNTLMASHQHRTDIGTPWGVTFATSENEEGKMGGHYINGLQAGGVGAKAGLMVDSEVRNSVIKQDFALVELWRNGVGFDAIVGVDARPFRATPSA
jgi:hypothetical protein